MSSATLYRWSGGTLIAASLLIFIASLLSAMLFPGHNSTKEQVLGLPWLLITLLTLIGSLLFVIGLPGMYLRQSERAGVVGFIGFILLFFALLLIGVAFTTLQVLVFPYLAQKAPQLLGANNGPATVFLFFIVTGLMLAIGSILLGIATLRAEVFPRWTGVLLLISGIISLFTIAPFPSPFSDIIEVATFATLALVFLWCGYTLMGRGHETAGASGLVESS